MASNYIRDYSTFTEILQYGEQYSTFGKALFIVLKNTEGKEVAKRTYIYHEKSKIRIVSEVIEDLTTGQEVHITKYESGEAINQRYLCLDKDGNILKKAGKVILLKILPAETVITSIYTFYNSYGYKQRSTRSVFPCKNCSTLSYIKHCRYVW